MDVRKLADAMAAESSEEAHDLHRLTIDDLHFLVGPVGNVEKALRLVL